MRPRHSPLFLLLLGILIDRGLAGEESRLLRRLTVDDGLSQNSVYSLHQDAQGFIWIGTADGLNRYDGYAITVFRNRPGDSTSLSDNTIRTMAEGRDNTLYVGTDRNVVRFDREHGSFREVWPEPATKLLIDRRGALWIGTAGQGVVLLDPATGESRRISGERSDPSSIRGNEILALAESPDSTVWVVTERGLNSIRPAGDRIGWTADLHPASFRWTSVRDMAADREGRLWIGTIGHGLIRFAPSAGEARQFRSRSADPSTLPSDTLYSVVLDRNGNLWTGTQHGPAFCVDMERGAFRRIAGGFNPGIRVCVDASGLLWVGTDGFGAELHTLQARRFQLLRSQEGKANSPGADFIKAVYEDAEGVVWIGTFNNGLTLWDRRRGAFRHLNRSNSGLTGKDVHAICEDSTGTAWIGTEEGLNGFDRRSGRIRFYPSLRRRLLRETPASRATLVNGIAIAPDGLLWIATSSGVDLFDLRSRKFLARTDLRGDARLILGSSTNAIYADGDSLVWGGTIYGGLLRYDRRSGETREYRPMPHDSTSLVSENVKSLLRDSRGRLWVATDQGLAQMSDGTGTFVRFDERSGLPSSTLYGILEDGGGNLWISTNHGIVRFSPEQRLFRAFDRVDGLQSNEFNSGAYFRTRAGEMYFGGVNGLNFFHPDSIYDNPVAPNVVLTGFKIFDQPALPNRYPPGTREISLRSDESVFSLQFAGLEYTNPSRNLYSYRLEGFEERWSTPGTRREVRYTSLPPGEYLFRVRAANSDGVWNNDGLAVRIVIVPPFWRTWWFYAICAIALLMGIGGTIRFLELRRYRQRIARLEQQEAVQRERARISRDMHDELGASLTRISLLAGIAGAPGRGEEEVRDHLKKIEETSRDVVQRLDEVVWMVNPKNDTLESLSAYVAEYAEQFFAESAIRCRFDFPAAVPAVPLSAETRRNVFLTIKEALNNIMKHSGARIAALELHLDPGTFRFTVRDDGKGFGPPEAGGTGNGLGNMRKRIEEAGGEFSLASSAGKGTAVEIFVRIPLS